MGRLHSLENWSQTRQRGLLAILARSLGQGPATEPEDRRVRCQALLGVRDGTTEPSRLGSARRSPQ